jgi:hypothetical protein
MPELSEGVEQGLVCDKFNEEQPASEKLVLGLHVDATQAEAEGSLAGSLPHLGHVYPLQSSATIQRGQCNDQTQVYPAKYSHTDNIPIESHGLVLSKVVIDPRNVILGFIDNGDEEYWLQVRVISARSARALRCPQITIVLGTTSETYSCSNLQEGGLERGNMQGPQTGLLLT